MSHHSRKIIGPQLSNRWRTCTQTTVLTIMAASSEHNACKFLLKHDVVLQINSGWMLLKDGFRQSKKLK